MSKINPCRPDCPRRAAGCQAECEVLLEAQRLKAIVDKERRRDSLIRGYFKDSVRRKRRRCRK